MRLWQFLSKAGFGSRRQVLEQFASLQVTVNGEDASPLRQLQVTDAIFVNGQLLEVAKSPPQIWAWHKMIGVDCNVKAGRADSVWTRLQSLPANTHPVGRLDKDSHGLMLLSTDGQLTHRLMHPSQQLWKTYHVQVRGLVSDEVICALRDGPAYQVGSHRIEPQPCRVQQMQQFEGGALLQLQLCEGKHRQIRYMCRAVGLTVVDLKRTAIGPLELGNLAADALRLLTPDEVHLLQNAV